jgi:hypothetical protein
MEDGLGEPELPRPQNVPTDAGLLLLPLNIEKLWGNPTGGRDVLEINSRPGRRFAERCGCQDGRDRLRC